MAGAICCVRLDCVTYLAMASLKSIVASLALVGLSLASPGKYPPAYHHGSGSGNDKLGAVASSSICSEIGTDVLKSGGNAADSLIATTFCVGVVGMVRRDHSRYTDNH